MMYSRGELKEHKIIILIVSKVISHEDLPPPPPPPRIQCQSSKQIIEILGLPENCVAQRVNMY